jgi:hypothetical protein
MTFGWSRSGLYGRRGQAGGVQPEQRRLPLARPPLGGVAGELFPSCTPPIVSKLDNVFSYEDFAATTGTLTSGMKTAGQRTACHQQYQLL